MHVTHHVVDTSRYAKCVEVSKRVRWDIDKDVVRGRGFDFAKATRWSTRCSTPCSRSSAYCNWAAR